MRLGPALGLLLAGLGSAAGAACLVEPARDRIPAEFTGLINAFRAKHGLGPLRHDARLALASERYACDMAEAEHFSHTGADGSTPSTRAQGAGFRGCALGENIAMGYADVAAVMQGWIDSPGHNANMRGDFTLFGIGLARVAPGMVVVPAAGGDGDAAPSLRDLARRSGAPAATPPPAPAGAGRAASGAPYWVLMLGRDLC